MPILASAANLFSSPPPNPRINDAPPPPLPQPPPPPPPDSSPNAAPNPALRSVHSRTRYYKPLPRSAAVIAADAGRSVVVGDSGVSYLLPGAPFEFQFSYSETPKARPVAMREPAFLPFAPPTMARPWTGKAPLMSKKEKERKKNRFRIFEPLDGNRGAANEMAGPPLQYPVDDRSREEILGAPLTRAEVRAFVKPRLSHNRQVNLGRDGLTHNMLELIHTHWRRQEVCKVRCLGVPTVDMDNVCHHLEEKTGGKIIHRTGGIIYLFRGRNYNPRTRPKYPVMLWKPATPVYPKLIQDAPEGLTRVEADVMRKKGQNLLPICKLAKNGIYLTLVKDVRDAFEGSQLVKINCQGMHASDYKKIGAKLKELVPCVLLSFDQEQILMWRGKDWKSRYQPLIGEVSKLYLDDNSPSADKNSGDLNGVANEEALSPKMRLLWRRAIDTQKALLLDEVELSPDSLLERVEEFQGMSQTIEHSYPALILSGNSGLEFDDGGDDYDEREASDEDYDDLLEKVELSVPFGYLPVDFLAKRLRRNEEKYE